MKMKKLCALTAVLLAAVMLSSVGLAAAEVVYFPELIVPEKTKGIIWYFSTDVDGDGVADFNGNNIRRNTIVVEWWTNDGNGGFLHPLVIITTKNTVMLVFCPRSLPDRADGNSVTGMLKNGAEFLASGPGFTYHQT